MSTVNKRKRKLNYGDKLITGAGMNHKCTLLYYIKFPKRLQLRHEKSLSTLKKIIAN